MARAKRPKGSSSSSQDVAVALCRCSTDRQDRSIEEQETAIRSWAKEQKVQLIRVFKDEGVSGLELSRPGLDACLDFITKSSKKGIVVLWSRDRLVRPEDPIDGLVMERQIRYAGWELCYLTGNNATGNALVDAILGLVEHHASGEYLRKLARDSLRNLLSRLRAGDVPGGKIPYGYAKAVFDEGGELLRTIPRGEKHRKAPEEVTRLVLGDPEEVETVRWLFREFSRGLSSPSDLALELEAREVPRPTKKPWNSGTIRDMLRNPVYVGDLVWNRETTARCVRLLDGDLSADLALHKSSRSGRRIAWARNDPKDHIVLRDRHEAIVSREDFAKAEAVREERARRQGAVVAPSRRFQPLIGLLFCGKCGNGMYGRKTTSKSRIYRYYVCSDDSHAYRLRADLLEQAVLTELRRLLRAPKARRAAARRKRSKTKSPVQLLVDLETALEEQDQGRARSVFRVLLERVSVHGPRGRPPKKRRGKRRTFRARLEVAAAVAELIDEDPEELVIE